MKSKIFIALIFFITGLCLSQQNTFNKDVELQKFVERGGRVEQISSDIYKLTYRTGESRTFNFNQSTNQSNQEGLETTIINVWEIDTTKFADMFNFWQKVEIANTEFYPVFIDDLNKNDRPELYGYTDVVSPNFAGPVKIFERDFWGQFNHIFDYDLRTVFVKGMGDIHQTGGKDIILSSIEVTDTLISSYETFFKSDSIDTLPTTFDFIFYYDANQINDMTFGDWDNNSITDCAFIDGAGTQNCIISEFRDSINNFTSIYQFSTIDQGDFSGFAIDDFDQDRKTELIFSSGGGNVYVLEKEIENQYLMVDQFSFPTLNAYMQTVTNDIDGNGKPEFWIGGQNLANGVTTYQCYEANSDNSYQPVARIELRYSVSLVTNYVQANDVDDDGKEELIISSGNNIFIIKYVGSVNNNQFKLLYAKLGEATQPEAEFNPLAIADLNGDGKKDMLIPFYKYIEPIAYSFSYIFKQSNTTNINGQISDDKYEEFIHSNPNPFNSVSIIDFHISQISNIQIKIYNILGKEVSTLLDKELSPGEYNINWEAKDEIGNPLPSGVYLIVLKTKESIKSFKTILLK